MKKLITLLFLLTLSVSCFSQGAGFYKLQADPQGIYLKKGIGCTVNDTLFSMAYAANAVDGGSWSLLIADRATYTYPNHGWYYAESLDDALVIMGININQWQTGKIYTVGDVVEYKTKKYKCIQGHTSQADWLPNIVPSLWTLLATSNNWTVGVAYKVNDIVIYVPNSFKYKCLQAHTAQSNWMPPAVPALWQKQ